MTIHKDKLFSTIFSLFAFVISWFLLDYYTEGDQIYYKLFYEDIRNYSFVEGYIYYNNILGASEPVYYTIIYIFSGFLSKKLLVALVNSVLAYNVSYLLARLKVNKIVIASLLLNFYLLILFTGAERLKFSLAILSFYFLFSTKFKQNIILVMSIFTHLQVLLLVIGLKFNEIKSLISRSIFHRSFIKRILFTSVIVAFVLSASIIFYLLSSQIIQKWNFYSSSDSISNILKPLVFLTLTLIYRGKTKTSEILSLFLPLMVASVLLGADRIVIFCYFIFFYHASKINNGINLGVIASQVYFIYKGLELITIILRHNTGFI